jgi:WD40 repeat protein
MQLTKHWATTLDDYVIDLAWSPDGAQLAAASGAGPISIFATADGAKQHDLPGHENGTNCLAWSAAGGLATGGQDGAVKFWEAANGQHIATAKIGSAWVDHVAWRPMPAQKPEAGSQRPASTSANDASSASGLRPPASAVLAAVAGRDLVFLNPDGSRRHAFKPAAKTITALAWEPGGGCATVAFFGGVTLWDADDFHAQKDYVYNNGIHALAWSPDSRWLVSGNQDPSVHLWLPEEEGELHMSGYESKVKHLSFDQTSRWLATGGGRDACIWDCSGKGPEGREPAMLPHDAPICALAFQRSHGLLVTASQDGVVMLWSPERKQPLRATIRMPAPATKLAWSPDDRQLAIGSEKGTVYVVKCEA